MISPPSSQLQLATVVNGGAAPGLPPPPPATTAEEKLRRFSMILEDEEEVEDEIYEALRESLINNADGGINPQHSFVHRPLHAVKSSPQLLRHIHEEDAAALDESGCTLRSCNCPQRVTVASPTYLRRLHSRRSATRSSANRQTTPSRSSSDNSDTEEGGPYSGICKLRRHIGAAVQEADHSSDTDVGDLATSTAECTGLETRRNSGGVSAGKCAPISEEAEDCLLSGRVAGAVYRLPREIDRDRERNWRRRSESADTTPARSLHKISQLSLNSSVTQSNFLCAHWPAPCAPTRSWWN